jgi:hypothetical protein
MHGSTSIGNVLIVTGVLGVIGGLIIGTFERNEQTDAKTAEDTTANILKVVEITTEINDRTIEIRDLMHQILDHLQIDNPKSGGDKDQNSPCVDFVPLIPPVKTLTYSEEDEQYQAKVPEILFEAEKRYKMEMPIEDEHSI